MNVYSDKRLELTQALVSLSRLIRMEKGCHSCEFNQSCEDEDKLFLLEEWDTQKHLSNHLRSEHFKVLQGAMNLPKEPQKMNFHTVLDHPIEFEKI